VKAVLLPASIILLISLFVGCVTAAATRVDYLSTDTGKDTVKLVGPSLVITQPLDDSIVRTSPLAVSGNAEPGVSLTVNGCSVELDGSHFSITVELEPGPNSIDVTAKDDSGNMTSKYLTVIYVP